MNIIKLNSGSYLNLDHIMRAEVRERRYLDSGPTSERTGYEVPKHLWVKLSTGEVLELQGREMALVLHFLQKSCVSQFEAGGELVGYSTPEDTSEELREPESGSGYRSVVVLSRNDDGTFRARAQVPISGNSASSKVYIINDFVGTHEEAVRIAHEKARELEGR